MSLATVLSLVNTSRVLDDLTMLRRFGATGGGIHGRGVSRPALSPDDMLARRWLVAQFEEAGLVSHIDGMGTVHGHGGSESAPALLMGSHTDTQPEGGFLDGALGVLYALEAARVLRDVEASGAWHVASFIDEEGRFSTLTGSKAFAGGSVPWENAGRGTGGVTLAQAAAAANLSNVPVVTWKDRPAGYLGYLEAHIEQGPMLERRNASLGVVSSIVGQAQLRITCDGEQNHAGTTLMRDRKDAALKAMQLGVAIDAEFSAMCQEEEGDECSSVWTLSGLTGFVSDSTVPGSANLTLQMRSPSQQYLDRMLALAETRTATTAADRVPCRAKIARPPSKAVPMDEELQRCILAASNAAVGPAAADAKVLVMHSGALHDAAPIAAVMPAAMLFVPSIKGISHSYDEHTHDADLALGAKAFVGAAASALMGQCDGTAGAEPKAEL